MKQITLCVHGYRPPGDCSCLLPESCVRHAELFRRPRLLLGVNLILDYLLNHILALEYAFSGTYDLVFSEKAAKAAY